MQLARSVRRFVPLVLSVLPAACGDSSLSLDGATADAADAGPADGASPTPDLGLSDLAGDAAADLGGDRHADQADVESVVKYDANLFAMATLTASPTAYSFANTAVGSDSVAAKFVITNIGLESTGAVSHVVDGPQAAEFVMTGTTCGRPLTYQDTCEVSVTFRPITPGTKTGRLILSATPGTSFTVLMNGVSQAPSAVRLDPTVHDFPITAIATPGAPPPTPPIGTFTVTNTGGTPVGPLSTVITGPQAADFAVAGNTCDGTLLDRAATCSISVRFKPVTAGAKTALLEVTAGNIKLPAATLAGVGAEPAKIVISPLSQSFGSLQVSAKSAYSFEIRNEGGADSGKPSFSLEGMNFQEFSFVPDPSCGEPLRPNVACTVTVTFAPAAIGSRTARLRVTANPGGSAVAELIGQGISGGGGALSLTSLAPDPFGTVVVGESSTGIFMVQNKNGVPTGKLTASLSGGQDEFTIAENRCPDSLPVDAVCEIAVRFTPQISGRRTANLQVSAFPGGFASLPISGNATAPAQLRVSHASRNFGTRTVGSTAMTPLDFTFSVVGTTMTGPLNVVIEGTDATSFQVAYNECQGTTLQAGRTSCRVGLRFVPASAGYKSASLAASATPGGVVRSQLYGTGN